MKNPSFYKYYRFTTLEIPNAAVFSYVLSGRLQFINRADGCGIYHDFGHGYFEFDIGLDIPQKNEFDRAERNGDVKVLFFRGYNHKAKINDKMSPVGKIDFDSLKFEIPYAVKFSDNGRILVPNEQAATEIIRTYPDMHLESFFNKTLAEFSK